MIKQVFTLLCKWGTHGISNDLSLTLTSLTTLTFLSANMFGVNTACVFFRLRDNLHFGEQGFTKHFYSGFPTGNARGINCKQFNYSACVKSKRLRRINPRVHYLRYYLLR